MSDAIQPDHSLPFSRGVAPEPSLDGQRAGTSSAALVLVLVLALLAGVLLVLIGTAFVAYRVGQRGAREEAARERNEAAGAYAPFWEARDFVREHYVDRDKVNDRSMSEGAIRGMLESLGDRGHTGYLTKEQAERQKARLSGEFEGIGATVTLRGREPIIARTLRNSPARKANLRAGDVLVKVDGEAVTGLSLEEVVGKVRGPAGSEVKLSVRRVGQKKLEEVHVTRAHVDLPEVTWAPLPAKKGGPVLAHLAIVSFSQKTDKQLRAALEEMQAAGVAGVVLDLRGNPGGLKEQAVKVASEFLPAGQVVFIQKDAKGREEAIKADKGGLATTLPLAVLIDPGTASSSEIVAGAIQDSGRGKLVGARTFGTGTVLRQYKLSDGGVIWLAYYQWLTPKGRKIWHQGISPDEGLAVTLPREAVLVSPDPDQPLTEKELRESSDAQLRKAVEVLEQAAR
jgi:carboxyl-terminal processing protease